MSNLSKYKYPFSFVLTASKSWVSHGLDSTIMLEKAGIPVEKLTDPNAVLTGDEMKALYLVGSRINKTSIPDSILVAEEFSFTNIGLLGLAMTAVANFGDALDLFSRFYTVTVPGLAFSQTVSGEDVFVDFSFDQDFDEALPFLTECMICVMKRFEPLFQKSLIPERIYFNHNPELPLSLYEDYLETSVEANFHTNRLHFKADALKVPIKHPDSATLAIIETQLSNQLPKEESIENWADKVTSLWEEYAEKGEFLSQKSMAEVLHVSARTLVRRLTEEGQSYRSIVQSLRLKKAKNLLSSTALQITEVANKVGFDDESTFFRFFKESTGVTPRAFRVADQ